EVGVPAAGLISTGNVNKNDPSPTRLSHVTMPYLLSEAERAVVGFVRAREPGGAATDPNRRSFRTPAPEAETRHRTRLASPQVGHVGPPPGGTLHPGPGAHSRLRCSTRRRPGRRHASLVSRSGRLLRIRAPPAVPRGH